MIHRRAARVSIAIFAAVAVAASSAPAFADSVPNKPADADVGTLAPETGLSPDEMAAFVNLYHGQERTVGTPYDPDKYRYTTNTSYWSGVAMDPGDANYDLALWADPQITHQLAKSQKCVGVDFVVVDSNRADVPTRYYPRVVRASGTGSYRIELDADGTVLDGEAQDYMASTDLISVMDTYLQANVSYKFTVSGSNPFQNPSIFLMRSTSTSKSWYQDSHDAVASANRKPTGETETFTYRPPSSGWYGFVLINKADESGTYYISRTP